MNYSIVIPLYNEAKSIKKTHEELIKLKPNDSYDIIEIIFVNDGSTDGSKEILEEIITHNTYTKLVHHSANLGYGAALKSGIKIAKGRYVAITDADGTYPNKIIPSMVENMDDFDMVVGSRVGKNSKIPLIRKPAKWCLNKLANYLTGQKIPDLNSGLRIIRKDVVEKFIHLLPDGFSFTTTITLAMLTNNYKVKYIPIDYYKRDGKSKIRPIYDTLNFLQLIIRTVLYFDPLKIFLPASMGFIGISLFLLFYRFFIARAFGVTATVFFISGIQLLAIGMIADLIDKRLGR